MMTTLGLRVAVAAAGMAQALSDTTPAGFAAMAH